MRRNLLDTSIVAGLLSGRGGIADIASPWVRRNEAATSIVVYAEVMEYIQGSRDVAIRARGFRSILRDVQVITVTRDIAEAYASLRRALRPPHGPGLIGDMDTMIAATALVRDLTLITADSDFQRVPDLQVRLVSPRR